MQEVELCAKLTSEISDLVQIQVYPNPFQTSLRIVSSIENYTLLIYNVVGTLIVSKTISNREIDLNLESLKKGIYFVRIGTWTKKIVKH